MREGQERIRKSEGFAFAISVFSTHSGLRFWLKIRITHSQRLILLYTQRHNTNLPYRHLTPMRTTHNDYNSEQRLKKASEER